MKLSFHLFLKDVKNMSYLLPLIGTFLYYLILAFHGRIQKEDLAVFLFAESLFNTSKFRKS